MYQARPRLRSAFQAGQTTLLEMSLNGLQTVLIPVPVNSFKVLYLETVLRYGNTTQPVPAMRFSVGGVVDVSSSDYVYLTIKNDPASGTATIESGLGIPLGTPPRSNQTAGYYQLARYEIYNPNDPVFKNVIGQINEPLLRDLQSMRGFWKNVGVLDGIQINLGSFDTFWDTNSVARLIGEV